ncbi:MAG: MATE family efflux transporter [Deltaproteobacteria bacterium]|nr:MATE family efflux transporter [Deltaproteobacteria bacterium]
MTRPSWRRGARYLRIVGWSQIFMALELVFVGAFSGAGETLVPMLIVVPVTLARWPIAHYTQEWGIGIEGVWWAISGTSIAKGILITAAFMRGRWKTRVV